MADSYEAPDRHAETVPEDESAQPIVVRKLDRLETTGLIAAL